MKLRDIGKNLLDKSLYELNRDRLENTRNRSEEARYARFNAKKQIDLVKGMMNLCDAIESGNAGILKKVTTKTQVLLLNSLLNRTSVVASSIKNEPYEGDFNRRNPEYLDIPYARYPYPYIDADDIVSIKNRLYFIDVLDDSKEFFKNFPYKTKITFIGINTTKELKQHIKNFETYNKNISFDRRIHIPSDINDMMKDHITLCKLGITNLEELKTALKEYLSYQEYNTNKVDQK